MPLPTSLVGLYAQPDWLVDKVKLPCRFPPSVRATELWRVGPEYREEAFDDATILAIRDKERVGHDIITDGEMRRESYSNRFATALEGVQGRTALHICFGYEALIRERPEGYDVPDTPLDEVSIETAQSGLDCSVLAKLPGETIILSVLELSTHEIDTPAQVAERIRRALPYVSAERLVIAPVKYLPRDVAFAKMQAMVEGAKIVRAELA